MIGGHSSRRLDMSRAPEDRRQFLRGAAGAGAAMVVLGRATLSAAKSKKEEPKKDEEEVSPTEDLMREHGVLRRILLVYGEVIRRLGGNQELKPETIAEAAQIVRAFVEDYHEKDEEEFIFPRFK
jgi:hypothetical protein